MAEDKSGPVKPPTLDMQARKPSGRTPRKAGSEKPGPEPAIKDTGPATPEKPETAKTEKRAATGGSGPARRGGRTDSGDWTSNGPMWVAAGIGAIGGAVLAVAAVMALLWTGLLTALMPAGDDAIESRLTAAEEQVTESLVGFNALNGRVGAAGERLDALEAETSGRLETLAARQDEFASNLQTLADSQGADIDLAPVEERFDALDARIDAVASGADGAEAERLAGELTAIRTDLDALATRLTEAEAARTALGARLATVSSDAETAAAGVSDLDARLANLEAGLGDADPGGGSADLALALSGLQSAFETGRPFAAELASLGSALPGLAVPGELAAAAADGLMRPGVLADRFLDAVPAIMAARPVNSEVSWGEAAWGRIKALLAVRPSGTGGDDIETALAEAEAAVAARDFAGAANTLRQLPQPMREAAGEVMAGIELMGAAQSLLARARTEALSHAAAPGATEEAPA